MKKITVLAATLCSMLGAMAQWAQVNVSVANVRSKSGESQELCTQEYLGMPVKILGEDSRWYKVETTDGYNGWISSGSLVMKSDQELEEWRESPRFVVTAPHQIWLTATPAIESNREYVTDLVPNDIVVATDDCCCANPEAVCVVLPDGRKGWTERANLTPIEDWANQEFDSKALLDRAYAIKGTPYLWGGNSVKGLDCSGLSKYCYLANGIFLRRDASMQARTGHQLDPENHAAFQQGDLLFFGNKETGKITHVAIYDADGTYIHSSGRGDRVGTNSVDPNSETYGGRPVIKATRIHGSEGTDGITKAIDHPWLFQKK